MPKTKKVGSAGRFGVRYGKRIKKRVLEIENKQKQRHKCEFCSKKTVKRVSTGIYECTSCKAKFTGRAYTPK